MLGVILGLRELGKLMGGAWAGFLTVILVLFTGEIDLDPNRMQLFNNFLFRLLSLSPNFFVGLIFYIPCVAECVRFVESPGKKSFLLLALLCMGCVLTKATIFPVIAGGLFLFAAYSFLRGERSVSYKIGALLVVLAIISAPFLDFYSQNGISPRIIPLNGIRAMAGIELLRLVYPINRLPELLFFVLATPVAFMGFMGVHLVALGAFFVRTRFKIQAKDALLLSFFLAGAGEFLVFSSINGIQIVFLLYGFVAVAPLAAKGALVLLDGLSWPPKFSTAIRVGALAALWLPAAIDTPLDSWLAVKSWLTGQTYVTDYSNRVTRGEIEALRWARNNTSRTDVLGVNNQMAGALPSYFSYSAFSERRIFLEGWLYTPSSYKNYDLVLHQNTTPFAERQKLNRAVFENADADALRVMREKYGVSFLFVDKKNATTPINLPAGLQKRFANADAEIYQILP
jgi:hypothetical protein